MVFVLVACYNINYQIRDDFVLAENICAIALIFIMFYGGFNTKWSAARKVAGKSIALATGGVLSSTDAASVFAILRKYKLNLKDGTASILEMESGSNDPVAYLLTLIAVSILTTGHVEKLFLLLSQQIIFGILAGLILAYVCIQILEKSYLVTEGLETIFIIATVLLCYAVSSWLNGNAYLSVYLYGIIIGNRRIRNKTELVGFFDGVTSLAQILIFSLLDFLPSRARCRISFQQL